MRDDGTCTCPAYRPLHPATSALYDLAADVAKAIERFEVATGWAVEATAYDPSERTVYATTMGADGPHGQLSPLEPYHVLVGAAQAAGQFNAYNDVPGHVLGRPAPPTPQPADDAR